MAAPDVDRILETLVKDVEMAVHAMYRGEVRQATAKARTENILVDARAALAVALGASETSSGPVHIPLAPSSLRPSVSAPVVTGAAVGWSSEEGDAVMRCINAWLPMGGPASTPPDTKCIAAGKMLIPTWGEREKARDAVRRITQP